MGSDLKAKELLERGVRLLDAGHYADGLRNLRLAYEQDPASARCLSYLGLATALGEKSYRKAEELCQTAIERQFYDSDFHHNLGLVYIEARQMDLAVKVLKRGLRLDPSNEFIRGTLHRIGWRRRPLIGFLPRDHVLNRGIGRIAYQYFGQRRVRL